jgi:hypothetical protein
VHLPRLPAEELTVLLRYLLDRWLGLLPGPFWRPRKRGHRRREWQGLLLSVYRDRDGFYVVLTDTSGRGSWRRRTGSLR